MTLFKKAAETSRRGTVLLAASLTLMIGGIACAQAGETFGGSVSTTDLTTIRGGDTNTDSNNTTLTSQSSQNTNATNQNNTIGGAATAGQINVGSNALGGMSGMSNVVMNTGNQANVQGIMSLNVTLH